MSKTTELDDYLQLIDDERESRPAEARLADEIRRLRAEKERLRAALGQIAGCDTPHCDACGSDYPEAIARDALDREDEREAAHHHE